MEERSVSIELRQVFNRSRARSLQGEDPADHPIVSFPSVDSTKPKLTKERSAHCRRSARALCHLACLMYSHLVGRVPPESAPHLRQRPPAAEDDLAVHAKLSAGAGHPVTASELEAACPSEQERH